MNMRAPGYLCSHGAWRVGVNEHATGCIIMQVGRSRGRVCWVLGIAKMGVNGDENVTKPG